MEKLVTSFMFKEEYLKNIPVNLQWQNTPLQIYPLSFLRQNIRLPLPTLRTNYNFLFFIKQGRFINRIDNQIHTCDSESIVFLSTATVSGIQEVSSDLKGYFILIEEETMSLFNQQELLNIFLIDPILKLTKHDCKWIHLICRLIHAELKAKNPNIKTSQNLTQALLNKILSLSEKEKSRSRSQQIAIQFKQLVYKYYISEKNVLFYAQELAVSSNYLNRCVKKVFHKSCKEIILETALLNSQILLNNYTKTISEICFELNFEDPSYFARIFKSFFGISPSDYRNKTMHDLS